jgi:hypothetical protein
MKWDGSATKALIFWVLIYPVAAHGPCGHICVPKNKSGTICLTTSHNHHNNINNTTSSLCPHQQPHKPTNTMQAAQTTLVHWLGRVCFFIHSLLLLLNVFYFLLGSILLLTMDK